MKEVLYRERFHLSDRQMHDESAEAVAYWLIVESERQAWEEILRRRDKTRTQPRR